MSPQIYYAHNTPYYTQPEYGTHKFMYTRRRGDDKFNVITIYLLYKDSGASIIDYWNRLARDSGSNWEYCEHKE